MHLFTLIPAALVPAGLLAAVLSLDIQQKAIADNLGPDFKCDLPPAVSPDGDGLPSADELFSGKAAFAKQVERHSAIVKVPSVSYDDLGEVFEDERWLVFLEFHKVLETVFPTVYVRSLDGQVRWQHRC